MSSSHSSFTFTEDLCESCNFVTVCLFVGKTHLGDLQLLSLFEMFLPHAVHQDTLTLQRWLDMASISGARVSKPQTGWAVPKCSIEYIPLYLQHNSLNSDFFRSFIWWLKSLDHFRRPSASPWASMRSGRCSVGDNGPSGPATAESTIQLWILNGYPTLKSKITAVSVFQSIFACYIAILYYLIYIYIYTHHDSILLYIIYIAIMLYSHMIMVR